MRESTRIRLDVLMHIHAHRQSQYLRAYPGAFSCARIRTRMYAHTGTGVWARPAGVPSTGQVHNNVTGYAARTGGKLSWPIQIPEMQNLLSANFFFSVLRKWKNSIHSQTSVYSPACTHTHTGAGVWPRPAGVAGTGQVHNNVTG